MLQCLMEVWGWGEERLGEPGGSGCAEPGAWAGQEPTKTFSDVPHFCLSISCLIRWLPGAK